MYLQPFANAFSADFNSGLFHNAKIKRKGFHLYFGVVAQVATISDEAKYFMGYTEGDIYEPQGPYKVSSVLGPTEGVTVPIEGSGGLLEYTFPGGFDVDLLPLALPQITIGALFGTELTVRYIHFKVKDVGTFDVFGWGVRHSIDQYIKNMPVNIAVGYYRQRFKLSEYMNAAGNLVNLQVSYPVPVVTFYSGVGYENSKVKVEYVYTGESGNDDEMISFDLKGSNTIRFTIGLTLNLGPVKIFGDYNFARQNTFTAGLGIGINEK